MSARSLQKSVDIFQQLHQQLVQLKLPIASAGTEVELVLKAMVAGLFTNAARRQPNGEILIFAPCGRVALSVLVSPDCLGLD